jgi:YHS domain-containing protein
MTEVDEFKAQVRGEAEAVRERTREMQAQAAEQYRMMQSNHAIFRDLSRRIREAMRPWIKAFAESLPDVTPIVTERGFGPAGRVFHGAFVTFTLPRSDRCPANIELRLGLETGVDIDCLILFYGLDIIPLFNEFERYDRIALPLDPSSVETAIEWFKQKALAFTRTYFSLFFNPEYQKGSEVPDVVLGRPFPLGFAKSRTEYRGVTYHFLTEESRMAFEQDPVRYIGRPSVP